MLFDSDLKDMHFLTVVVKVFDLPLAYGCTGWPEVITLENTCGLRSSLRIVWEYIKACASEINLKLENLKWDTTSSRNTIHFFEKIRHYELWIRGRNLEIARLEHDNTRYTTIKEPITKDWVLSLDSYKQTPHIPHKASWNSPHRK